MKKISVGLKNTMNLTAGNIFLQVIGFIFGIYVARVLKPTDYGVYNTASAFVGMFGFLTIGGYIKVVLRNTSGELEKLKIEIEKVLSIKTAFVLFSIILVIVFAFIFNYENQLIWFIGIYAFTLLSSSFKSIYDIVFQANNRMQFMVYSSILEKLLYVIPAGLFLYFGGGVTELIIIYVLSTYFSVGIRKYFADKYFKSKIDIKKIFQWNYERRTLSPALVFSLLSFIGYFYSKIDIVMLSAMTGQRDVGIYSAAFKMVAPVQLIGSMSRVAFFPIVVENFKKRVISAGELIKYTFWLALILVPISAVISLFSKDIIGLLLGAKYLESAQVLEYLIWIEPLGIITTPFVLAMQANHHEKKLIIPNILRSLSNVILNFVLIKKFGLMGCVYSTLITYFWYYLFINFGYQYIVLKRSGNIK